MKTKTQVPVVSVRLVKERSFPYRGELSSSPAKVANLFREFFDDLSRENVGLMMLDAQHKVIGIQTLFVGTTDECRVYPKEIVKLALLSNAVGVILCHNHPSGNLKASREDEVLTKKLAEALALIDVTVLDHVILSEDNFLSLREEGLLPPPRLS